MGTMGVKALTFDIIGTVFDAFGSLSAGVPPLAQEYALTIGANAFAAASQAGYSSGVAAVSDHAQP
jgi:hypothetical protein